MNILEILKKLTEIKTVIILVLIISGLTTAFYIIIKDIYKIESYLFIPKPGKEYTSIDISNIKFRTSDPSLYVEPLLKAGIQDVKAKILPTKELDYTKVIPFIISCKRTNDCIEATKIVKSEFDKVFAAEISQYEQNKVQPEINKMKNMLESLKLTRDEIKSKISTQKNDHPNKDQSTIEAFTYSNILSGLMKSQEAIDNLNYSIVMKETTPKLLSKSFWFPEPKISDVLRKYNTKYIFIFSFIASLGTILVYVLFSKIIIKE